MTISSVVPVAVVASVGALATARTVRLAWTGENRVHRKLFLSLLLLVESLNLLVPLGAFNQAIKSFEHRPVFALGAFLAILHLQELLSFVISYSKTWSIYAEYKSAGLVPEYFSHGYGYGYQQSPQHYHGRDRLFKRPLFLIVVGLVLGIFLQPYGQVVVFLGVLWFAGIASFLSSRVWPEDRVLEKIAKSWKLRIVLALIVYLVVAPLVIRAVGIEFYQYQHSEDASAEEEQNKAAELVLRQNLSRVDSFLTSYEGVAVAVLLLAYKLAVLGTLGGIRRCYWSCHGQGSCPASGSVPQAAASADAEGAAAAAERGIDSRAGPRAFAFGAYHPHMFHYPGAAAAGAADRSVLEPLAPSVEEHSASEGVSIRVPGPSTAAAPSAPQGYAFYA